jgi:hypothetical protein
VKIHPEQNSHTNLYKEINVAITALQEKQILQVVVSVFNAGISGANLSAIAGLVESGVGMFQLANFLANGSTYRDLVMGGKITIPDQASVIMKSFGFVADNDPSSAGSQANNYITAVLTEGATLGDIINSVTVFLTQDPLTLPANFAPAAALLNNKVLVAKEYIGRNAPDTFEGNLAVLAGVTATGPSSPEEITAYLDSNTANNVSLTVDTDNLIGTSGIDIYSGVVDQTGSATTISNGDILDGGAGTDQLDIRIGSLTTSTTLAFVSKNVENFFIQNQDANSDFVLDFTNISEEAQVWNKGSVAGSDTIVVNLDPTTIVGMADTIGSSYDANFSGDRSGTDDAFTLALNGAGTTTTATNFSTVTTSGANDATFEIANITSTTKLSNVSLGVDAMTLKTINVSGDATLMLNGHNSFAGLSTVDASSMTAGGLQIDAQGSNEANFTFTGSAFDDRLVLKRTTIDTSGVLNGGAGDKDTIATTNIGSLDKTAINKATGFEILENTNGAQSFSAADFTINQFLFSGSTSSSRTISNIESDDLFTFASDITGSSYGLRLEGKNAGTAAKIALLSTSATNGETVITASNNNNDVYGVEIRTNISTLNIDSAGTGTNANLIEANSTNNSDNSYAIGNSSTALIEITGNHALTLQAKAGLDISNGNRDAGFSSAANIDASAFTGALRIAGSSSNDVIKGGSNADIIYGQNGADTITGNGGADQFRLSGFDNSIDTITDFLQGTDKVGLNAFDFGNTTATQSGATLASDDYIENRDGITNIGSSEDKKVVELQESLSSSQIASDTGAAVEAYVLVHNTSTNKAELWYDNDWSTSNNRDHVITFDNVVDLAGVKSFTNVDFVEFTY